MINICNIYRNICMVACLGAKNDISVFLVGGGEEDEEKLGGPEREREICGSVMGWNS